jgi:hypothetical protein
MKKLLFVLSLLSLTLSSMLVLSSCDVLSFFGKKGKEVDDGSNVPAPEFYFVDAKKNLSDEGYEVKVTDDFNSDYGLVATLYAYADDDRDYDNSYDRDYDDSLIILEFADKELARLAFECVKASVDGSYNYNKDTLEINKYLKENHKRDFTSTEYDELKDQIRELEYSIEEIEEDERVIGRDGVFVWVGTLDAIRDSK